LDAWNEVQAAIPSAELIAIGPDGQDRQGIRFVGRGTHEAKSTWMQSAAILVAPNLGGESFGLVVAEGMAAGCAIVASDLRAFQYVTAGTARLTPIGQPRPLAAALIDLLAHPAQTTAMGKRSRERAKAFDWAEVFPQYRSAYVDALGIYANAR
jgi:phosphatidylinositol alpha-mannosyltransferase